MSEGRRVFVVALGLVALIVLIQVGTSTLGDRRSVPQPTASASAAGPSAPTAKGCPAELELPDGVTERVCRTVDDGDLTTVQPTDDPVDGEPVVGFRSPSGSIACTDVRGETVACAVKGWTFDAGETSLGETLILSAGPPLPSADVRVPAAAVDAPGEFSVPGLQFGQIVRMNSEWFCGVEEVGVSCWSPEAGSGLLVSRTQWTTWTPEGVEGAS